MPRSEEGIESVEKSGEKARIQHPSLPLFPTHALTDTIIPFSPPSIPGDDGKLGLSDASEWPVYTCAIADAALCFRLVDDSQSGEEM